LLIEAARTCGLPIRVSAQNVQAVSASTFRTAARRPLNSRLDNRRLQECLGIELPNWQVHVQRFVEEIAG
jgi:dTDP-4-dehydrorhamnose reductase